MELETKIDLVRSVLDELATVGYLTNYRHRAQALQAIKGILSDYQPPKPYTKADHTIRGMKLLADLGHADLKRQLFGLAQLAEKALTELHGQFAQTVKHT